MRSFPLLLALLLPIGAVAQYFDWAYEAGGLGSDAGRAVCTDAQGNVIMVGSYPGNATFGSVNVTGLGGPDGFIAKFTAEGEQLWLRTINGHEEDLVRGVTTDPEGNIYVTGHFTDSTYLVLTQTDTVQLVATGGQDVFVAKYTPDGTLVWAERAGGAEDDTGTDIAWHPDGRLVVSGGFQGRATFANVPILASGLTDAFLMLMQPDGHALWVRNGGGLQHDVAASVSVDQSSGDIYITGDFFGAAQFGGTALTAAGSSDMFLVKYTVGGDLLWAVSNGSTNLDVATSVGCDNGGNVYVAGHYQGTTQFGTFSHTARGYNDVFVAQFSGSNGDVQWFRSMGGAKLETCQGMVVTEGGTTYTIGMFDSLLVSAPDSLLGDGYDIFIACLNSTGETRYLKGAGAGGADIPMGVCLGQNESLFISGFFYFFADFDAVSIGNAQNGDIFLARLTEIVGIEEAEAAIAQHCLYFEAGMNTMHLTCQLEGNWRIVDLMGRVLAEGALTGNTVALPNLPSGYYLFAVSNGQTRVAKPFIVR